MARARRDPVRRIRKSIAPHPVKNPRGTTFRAVEVEHYEATMFPGQQIRGGGEWNPEWDE